MKKTETVYSHQDLSEFSWLLSPRILKDGSPRLYLGGLGRLIKRGSPDYFTVYSKTSPCFPGICQKFHRPGRKPILPGTFYKAGKLDFRIAEPRRRERKSSLYPTVSNSTAGFSLLETLIAMAIMFFLLAGAAQMLCYSYLLKQKADLHRISADLISRKVEVLKSLAPGDEALSPGVHQETVQDRNSGRYFFLSWEVIEEEGLKKVQLSLYPGPFGSRPPVRVSWYFSETLGF
ncbi:MAG: prepilin-type N-terminal cleavage/methylation domain-containing protein [Candidatus Saccharicenans sp.]|nr:prepilin-type N-terminal cleavage/methylation domain-containing protein [Candidatus Saccharicenans sp.]